MKFMRGGVKNRSAATSNLYLLTVFRLEFTVTVTGIILEFTPIVPAMPVDRSCWNDPTTSSGTASLNEFCTFGSRDMTYPADIGTSVGPAVRFGCPKA